MPEGTLLRPAYTMPQAMLLLQHLPPHRLGITHLHPKLHAWDRPGYHTAHPGVQLHQSEQVTWQSRTLQIAPESSQGAAPLHVVQSRSAALIMVLSTVGPHGAINFMQEDLTRHWKHMITDSQY